MHKLTKYLTIAISYIAAPCLIAFSAGTNSDTLDEAIKNANAAPMGGDTTILFENNVRLISPRQDNRPTQVRALNATSSFTWIGNPINLIAQGGPKIIDGAGAVRGFFIGGQGSNSTGVVVLRNLKITNTTARGGNGVGGGGGGLGAGGGLYVGTRAIVQVENCDFINCKAIGGDGSTAVRSTNLVGGGGGLKGSGGLSAQATGSGGGGFGGNGGAGAGGGCSDYVDGNAQGSAPGGNFDGVRAPPGDPGIGGAPGQIGGFGGGGGSNARGGFYGGGGTGEEGAFGGGGGGSFNRGGRGGFGGGGGGGLALGNRAIGGFGGGDGQSVTGGRGAGFGGAIFIEPRGELTLKGRIRFQGNSASSGSVGNANRFQTDGFGALGQDIFMMVGSTLTFDITEDLKLQNPIHGDLRQNNGGGVIKKGPALLHLTGDNTYTGGTKVQEGEFKVTGSSVLHDVVVEAGGLLSGAFEIFDGNLANNGTIDPGDDDELGTIEVSGNFINGGTVVADIQPGFLVDNDAIEVDGQTTLSPTSTLILFPLPGNYIAGTDFVIIDGVTSGTFGSVVQEGPLAGLLDFDITYSSVIATVLNNRIFEDQNITAGPAKAVVSCVLAAIPIVPHSDFAQVVEELGTLTDRQVNRALVNISPVAYGALEWINARNNSYIANLLSQFQFELCCSPRDCCSCTCNSNVWINGFGNFMNNHDRLDNLQPYTADAGGVLVGVDYCFGSCYYLGASFGYIRTDLDNGDMNTYLGALYGIFKGSCLSFDISLIGGGTENDVHRYLNFGDVRRKAKSDFWTQFFTAHLGLRTNWEYCCFNFEPFALFDYHFFHRNGFHEHGAQSLNLDVKSKNQSMMRLEAGIKGYYSIMCDCYCFAPYLGLSYVGESPFGKSHQKASFTDQSCVIDAVAYDSWVNLGSGEAGIKWTHVNGFSFVVGYKGLFNTKTSINEVEGRLEWVF